MSRNTSKTILILAANPTSTARLRLDEEVREIDLGLQLAKNRSRFRLVQKWAVRQRDFYRAILEYQPKIIHFCGHGTGEDGIVLEDETGQPVLIEQEALAKLFKLFAVTGVECVVLNACFSEKQAQAISQYIKYVIGMNKTIGDKAAVNFAVAFYDALAAGNEVPFAHELGCTQLVGLKEDQTPVLKVSSIHPADIEFVAGDIPPNPYLGLSAFDEKDAAFFFGRETFTEELFQMTHQQPLVAVIGASGSGKSSVVFAGLIPKLRETGIWLIESFRPKSQPFDELALALVRQLEPDINKVERAIQVGRLAESLKKGEVKLHQVASQVLENKPNKRFLLVVDQFEELYTQYREKEEQQRFIDILLAAVHQKSITLVFTLRADFYGYILSYRPFGEALQQFRHTPLTLMSREELLAAIEQPAQKLNIQLQTHLAQRILDDVGQEQGNLPLLEFALTQLWLKQDDNELTHKTYDEIGGIKQALIKHAELIYHKLSDTQQKQAQRIFLQLVRLGEGTEDTRRVATLSEVGKENWELIAYLAGGESRLIVTGRNDKSEQETVEVIHEALIREWGRLRQWVNENREKLIQQRKIETGAIEWRDKNKSKDYLLGGKQLNSAQVFQKEQTTLLRLSPLAYEFIQKSLNYRRNNRLRLIGLVFLPIIFLTIFLGFIGYQEIRVSNLRNEVEKFKGQKESYPRIKALEELVTLGASLNKIDLTGADLSGADLNKADLRDADLRGAVLSRAKLSYANLGDANLSRAVLSGANLNGTNLNGANLTGAVLSGASLNGASLNAANLTGANLNKADLLSADLSVANLSGANLIGALLYNANLSGANLIGADLLTADLRDADLRGADLEDAQFGCVKRLNGRTVCTDLRNAKNLTPKQVKQAKNWQQATYDPEFRKKLGLPAEKEK